MDTDQWKIDKSSTMHHDLLVLKTNCTLFYLEGHYGCNANQSMSGIQIGPLQNEGEVLAQIEVGVNGGHKFWGLRKNKTGRLSLSKYQLRRYNEQEMMFHLFIPLLLGHGI